MNDHQHHLKFLFPLRAATRSDDPRTPCFSVFSPISSICPPIFSVQIRKPLKYL